MGGDVGGYGDDGGDLEWEAPSAAMATTVVIWNGRRRR